MKNNYTKMLGAIAVSVIVTFVSCSKDEPVTPVGGGSTEAVKTVKNTAADPNNTGHYTFFSLRENKEIALVDSPTTKWDIAFRTTNIIINGGSSGPGMGGAQVVVNTFNDLKEAPADGYSVDSPQGKAIPTGSGNGWYNYDQTTNVISPIPGRVIVVKTADGKYAKIEILSYYKDAPSSPTSANQARYYAFRFNYQADGSRKFN